MSLLREIQNAAVSSDNKIADILRKCKILAARLGNKEFEEWVENELNGYQSKDQLPDYRVLERVESKGHFGGPFGSGLRNALIPPSCIEDKQIREFISTEYLSQGISTYEHLLSSRNEGTFQIPWPADLVALYGEQIYENMNCMQAWKVISRGSIVGLIDSVRNRVLSFVIEIEKVNPEAGEAPPNSEPIPQRSVSQIFHTHIYGNVGSFSSGNQNSYQSINFDIRGDLIGLKQELKNLGVEERDISLLEEAILEDKEQNAKEIGRSTAKWLSNMLDKAAKGALHISANTVCQILPRLICNYLGI
ncbi:MAG: hypothetical protein HPY66_0146 [Firmicutes bacterium]|nr:hypothetical protein [Bacillota bacterium]MDI6705440.1 hypothetical protein [Bacillota bacterium]